MSSKTAFSGRRNSEFRANRSLSCTRSKAARYSSFLRNRRGDWIQIFLLFFFFLLLFIALALLFVEKDTLRTTRPEMGIDLLQQRSDTALVSLLRQPVQLDINEDGTPDPATVADAIAAGKLEPSMIAMPQGALYIFTAGEITVSNVPEKAVGLRRESPSAIFARTVQESSLDILGNRVTLKYADPDMLRAYLRIDVRAKDWSDKMVDTFVQETAEAGK